MENMEQNQLPKRLTLTAPKVSYQVSDDLIAGVITEAVWSEKRRDRSPRPGLWQDMISALKRGAAKSKRGTAESFLFQAMVDRLLEEFHAGEEK